MNETFLADIQAQPGDDAPRLVYADWLDEHGSCADRDRAEFIRVQVALGRAQPGNPLRATLMRREQALLRQHATAWLAHLPTRLRPWAGFRRGFLACLQPDVCPTCAPDDFPLTLDDTVERILLHRRCYGNPQPPLHLGLADLPVLAGHRAVFEINWFYDQPLWPEQLHPRQPTALIVAIASLTGTRLAIVLAPAGDSLRVLVLRDVEANPDWSHQLADWDGLARLKALDLSGSLLDREGLRTLLESPHLPEFEHLNLRATGLDREGVALLARCPRLSKLRALSLRGNRLTEDDLEPLLRSPHLRTLEALDLGHNDLGPRLPDVLGQARLPALRKLALDSNRLGPLGGAALARSRVLENLVELDVSDSELADRGVAALARSPHAGTLALLALGRNEIGPAGAAALAKSEGLPSLAVLDLERNRLGARGAEALARGVWPCLTVLRLGHNHLGSRGVETVARAAGLTRLQELHLAGNGMGDGGVIALAEVDWRDLVVLDLGDNRCGYRAARALAASGLAGGLVRLRLAANALGPLGAAALAECPRWVHLARLDLAGCNLGPGGAPVVVSPSLVETATLCLPESAVPFAVL